MDTEGADHLQGGEEPMLARIANQFRAKGLAARVAIADTWGAANARARAITREVDRCSQRRNRSAVEKLPISLLRLPAARSSEICERSASGLIGELANTPRAPLTLRFGPEIGRRLDQMFGRMPEPIDPIRTDELIEVSRSLLQLKNSLAPILYTFETLFICSVIYEILNNI